MLNATRFVASLAICTWGVVMVLLGLVNGVLLWAVLGLVVAAVGTPILGSHPWATPWLYPAHVPD